MTKPETQPFLALRIELMKAAERHVKEREFIRTTDELRKRIRDAPAVINAIAGREVFPCSLTPKP